MQSTEIDYKKYVQLIVRGRELFLALALLIMIAAIIISCVLPRKYEAKSTVFIEKNVIGELVKGITVTPSMDTTIKVLTYAITSRTLLTKVADSLDMNLGKKSDTDSEGFIKGLQANIDVKVKDQNLFIISFKHENPRIARDFVNTLVRLYIEENTSSKREESYGATKFLSEQIDTFKTKLDKAEEEVNAYKREKGGTISIDEGKLFEQTNIAQQKLYDLELRRRQLEGMRKITKKGSDPLYGKLLALQKKLEDLRSSYTETYPEVIKTKDEIDAVKAQMSVGGRDENQSLDPQELAKIDSEIAAIKVSEDGLRRYISSNESLLRNIPSAKAGLQQLEIEKNNQKNIYDQLFARHGQSEVSKQMEVQDKASTFRIVDPAVLPIKPVSPNRLKIMMLGIVGGIAASFGFLLLLDQKDTTIKGVDYATGFGLPVLAVIPHIFDQETADYQRKRTMRVYSCALLFFLIILCFPLMELLGLTYLDKVADLIYSVDTGSGYKGH